MFGPSRHFALPRVFQNGNVEFPIKYKDVGNPSANVRKAQLGRSCPEYFKMDSEIEDMEIDPPQQESTSQLELNLIPKPSPNVYEVANPTRLLVTLAHRIPAF